MTRHLSAVILAGGWILLFNPEAHRPMLDLPSWKHVDEYDTAYACQNARREEIKDFMQREHETAMHGEERYRCERAEHVGPRKEPGKLSGMLQKLRPERAPAGAQK